jgi:hypothetical protein
MTRRGCCVVDEEEGWSVGWRATEGNKHRIGRVSELTVDEVKALKADFRHVNDLADLDGFARVLESGNRWKALLDKAAKESDEDGAISAQTHAAARSELAAFTHLYGRLLDEMSERVVESASETEAGEVFRDRCAQLRRSGPFASLADEGRSASSGDFLKMRKGLDPLYVTGFEVHSADELVGYPVGRLQEVLVPYYLALRPHYLSIVAKLRPLIAEVDEGMPSLIRWEESVGEVETEVPEPQMVDFPVFALASLDKVFEELDGARPVDAILQLIRGRSRRRLRFGAASADGAAIGGNSKSGLDAIPSATVTLDTSLLGSEPIDYWATLTDTVEEGGFPEHELFRGSVQSALADGDVVQIESEGAVALTEQMAGGLLAANIPPAELIQALIDRSGWDGGLHFSEEPDRPPQEPFVVSVPVEGLEVEDPIALGRVTIIPRERGPADVAALESGEDVGETGTEMIAEYLAGSCYLVAELPAETVDAGEAEGLLAIDTALSWLTVRGRYGAAVLPDGEPQSFDRRSALRPPVRGDVVLVRGTATNRLWLRRQASPRQALDRRLGSADGAFRPALPAELDVNDRLALLALRLAAGETDPLLQVQALWQAIESYAERRKGERRLFTKREKAAISEELPTTGLNSRQRKRLEEAVESLNHEPLGLRLERRLKRDAVQVTQEELELLDRLRDVRNDVVHGRAVESPPQRDDINYGISIVARMLVHRIAAVANP